MNWMYICEHGGCRVITYHGVRCPSCGLVGRAIIIVESETTPTERFVKTEERVDSMGWCRVGKEQGRGCILHGPSGTTACLRDNDCEKEGQS